MLYAVRCPCVLRQAQGQFTAINKEMIGKVLCSIHFAFKDTNYAGLHACDVVLAFIE